jgi:hypothetical protein
MKIRTFYRLENDVYSVSIYIQDWSEGDKNLMQEFGEPQIDLGGTFGTGPNTFTLPNRLASILTNSPFTQNFDSRDYPTTPTAEDCANTWATTIASRLASAVTTLRANVDDYSRETVETV